MSYDEIENEILRRKQKAIFDAVAEFRNRANKCEAKAQKRDTLSHDAILLHGQQLAYRDAAEYLENILKK